MVVSLNSRLDSHKEEEEGRGARPEPRLQVQGLFYKFVPGVQGHLAHKKTPTPLGPP